MSNRFGTLFHVTTFGESHGVALGCVVDGCPPQINLTKESIQAFLNRRKPGQNQFTSPRAESDECEILSGVQGNVTLGTPIAILVKNCDKNAADYNDLNQIFRPSHADYTTFAKYGICTQSGGGRASARETIGRVAAAAVAKCLVNSIYPELDVLSWVDRMETIQAHVVENKVTLAEIEASPLRCPDMRAQQHMEERLLALKKEGDSAGGCIKCVVKNVPPGLGDPVFDKLEAQLAKAMLSLPASKSFEVGSGLSGTFLTGSQHNDEFSLNEKNEVMTNSNNSGGIQGGISNGMPIVFKVGFKPVSTIFKAQQTLDKNLSTVTFTPQSGRHDPCVLPRAVPLVDAMVWLVLADHILRQRSCRLYTPHE